MFRKSLSLTAELLLTLVGLVIVTTIALTFGAYRTVHDDLENDATRLVRGSADQVAGTLTRFISQRSDLGRGFLSSVTSLCGETTPRGRTAWELGCVNRALSEFRTTERAAGAVFEYRQRRIASVGTTIMPVVRVPDGFARLVPDASARQYVISATLGDSTLTEYFPLDDFDVLFRSHAVLGTRGEIFLVSADGQFLTEPRYVGESTRQGATSVEPIAQCLEGPAESIGLDYRGVKTIHGFRPVAAFAEGACVDAHLAYDEAVAPADTLFRQLSVLGTIFVGLGVLLSLGAAHWISAPVRRLAVSAAALERGEFDRPIPIGGPSEVRALGRGFAGMARAVADLVAREQIARQTAEAANRTKDEFLATVSHELRSPLTAILGWAQMFRFAKLEGEMATRAISAIERAAETQSRLVEDLLDVSRVVAGKLEIARNPASLADAAEAAVEAVRPDADAKGIALQCEVDGSIPPVLGDIQRLQQIVSNLLTNAVKFTQSGGKIAVRLQHTDGVVRLTVSDTGVGIAPDFLPHVFERFRQAEGASRDSAGGLGLGLAIVRHLVKLHGGEVTVASDGRGKGTTFTVTLPTYKGALPAPSAGVVTAMRGTPHRLDAVKVLLVDDDQETLRVVRAMLENAGASVETASSAAEARSALTVWQPAVLVSDLAMPDEDGYALIQSVRASDLIVPAIALSALARRDDAERAHAAGFQVYMRKPVSPDALVDAVASLVSPERIH